MICPANEFRCGDGVNCFHESQICDGVQDCKDNIDELDCACEFKCFNGTTTTCINTDQVCNGQADCPDGSDETQELCHPTGKKKLLLSLI